MRHNWSWTEQVVANNTPGVHLLEHCHHFIHADIHWTLQMQKGKEWQPPLAQRTPQVSFQSTQTGGSHSDADEQKMWWRIWIAGHMNASVTTKVASAVVGMKLRCLQEKGMRRRMGLVIITYVCTARKIWPLHCLEIMANIGCDTGLFRRDTPPSALWRHRSTGTYVKGTIRNCQTCSFFRQETSLIKKCSFGKI